jgi:hypothetical protein
MAERLLKRSELYELVWKQPVRTVAADIGISDVALAKACRKHKIPMPGRGAWRRKECGYKVKQVPLPMLPDGKDPIITFRATRGSQEVASPPSPEEALEQRPENRVTVAQELLKRHKFVRRTLANLRQQARGPRPLVSTRGIDRFQVSVARTSFERVERLLQALVRAWTVRGYELVEGEAGKSLLTVKVNGEPIALAINERTKRVVHVPTEKEKLRMELNPGWEPDLYDTVPTGTLAIRVANSPDQPQRATVRDRSGAPLEVRLNELLARMAEAARLIRERHEEQERQRKKWEEEARRREEARQQAQLERARLRRMTELVELWQEQEGLRGFLDVVRKRMEDARPELIPAAEAWVKWAEDYLEERHPADALFFEPLIQPGSSEFYHYSTTNAGPYGY